MAEDEGEEREEDEEDAFGEMLKQFLEEYREPIGEILRAYAHNMKATLRQKGWTTLGVFLLLVGMVAAISLLAWQRIVTGEAVAFVVGAVVGYLFSFLRRFVWGIGGR